jgi:hypothetical protein
VKAPYDVTLSQCDDGSIIVRVGCKVITFVNTAEMTVHLHRYFTDPEATIREFEARYGWKTDVGEFARIHIPPGTLNSTPTHPYPGVHYPVPPMAGADGGGSIGGR